MSTPSTLMIPVENQVRELDAKLLLACAAVERGYPVVLGSRAFLHYRAGSIRRGVYLAKSMRSLSDRMFALLRMLGHEIVGFDEEGLVRLPDAEYYRRRLSGRALALVSQLLAWGPDDARVFREFPGYPGIPIHITGNPRLDVMRPELRGYFDSEIRGIRERFGRFILINTNFGEVNHFFASLSEARMLALAPGLAGQSEYMNGRARFRLEIFQRFQQMVPALAEALPDQKIVLRPHPSESHALWRKLTAGFGNVHVINEGSVLPWLLASSVMVSNGCTTAIEAHVLGVPAINFQPIVDATFDDPLPQALCHPRFDLESLAAGVREAHDGKLGVRDDAESRACLSRHLSALSGPLAVDRILDVLDEAGYGEGPPPAVGAVRFAAARLQVGLRTLEKRINMRRPGHRNHWSYHAHRFPDISRDELQRRVARFAQLTGRFGEVEVSSLSPYLFALGSRGSIQSRTPRR